MAFHDDAFEQTARHLAPVDARVHASPVVAVDEVGFVEDFFDVAQASFRHEVGKVVAACHGIYGELAVHDVVGVVQFFDDAERPQQCPVGLVFPHHVDDVLFAALFGKDGGFVGGDFVGNTVLFEQAVAPGGAVFVVAAVVLFAGGLDGYQAGDGAARDFFGAAYACFVYAFYD